MNSEGRMELGVATNTPELQVDHRDGFEEVHQGGPYEIWMRINIVIRWPERQFSVTWTPLDENSVLHTFINGTLKEGLPIKNITWSNVQDGLWHSTDYPMHMRLCSIHVAVNGTYTEFLESPVAPTVSPSASSFSSATSSPSAAYSASTSVSSKPLTPTVTPSQTVSETTRSETSSPSKTAYSPDVGRAPESTPLAQNRSSPNSSGGMHRGSRYLRIVTVNCQGRVRKKYVRRPRRRRT